MGRIVVNLDDQAVRAGGHCGQRHGVDEVVHTGAMAGIHHHGQVGQLVQHWNRGDIQRVAGGGFESADTALAENDIFVAAGHDVLGAHQQFLDGVGKAALEQDGLADLTQLLEQLEVLHVARANLNDVNVLKQRQMVDVHDLGDDGQAGFLLGFAQQLDALAVESLEGVGGGAGLERAAAEHICAGSLDGFGHRQDLVVVLH